MKTKISPEKFFSYAGTWAGIATLTYFIFKDIYEEGQPALIAILAILLSTLMVVVLYLLLNRSPLFDPLTYRIRSVNHRGKYLNKILYRYMHLEDRNLGVMRLFSLPLNEVYITLQMIPISGKDDPLMSGLLVHIDEQTRAKARPIWDFIQVQSDKPNHYVIIGNPGSGKSTLLRHVALTLASNASVRRKFQAPTRIPVLISLREHWRKIAQGKHISLDILLKDDFKNSDLNLPDNFCAEGMKAGNLVIMLDGLDEIPDSAAQARVFKWVEELLANATRCPVIITTRPHGYQKQQLTNVTSLFIAPLTRADANQFINNWYIQAEYLRTKMTNSEVRSGALAKAVSLYDRIGLRRLWELATNPMLLNMIILIDWTGTELPAKRAGLFQKVFEVFLEDYPRAKGLTIEIQADDGIRILSPLAYKMNEKQQLLIDLNDAADIIHELLGRTRLAHSPIEFIKRIEQLSGILVDTGEAQYTFAHRSFQDFLAAEYVKEHGTEQKLLENLEDTWWHETILLYAVRKDGTNVINACLRKTNNLEVLKLAITCNEEASVSPETRKLLEQVLYEKLDDTNVKRRQVVIEALLESQFNPLTISEKGVQLSTPVTNAIYTAFLDECDKERKRFTPDHWNTRVTFLLEAKDPILGIRPSDAEAFCAWLNNRPRTRWHYRLPTKTEADTARGALRFWTKGSTGKNGYAYECIERFEEREFFIRDKINHIAIKDLEIEAKKMISKNQLDMNRFFEVLKRSSGNISTNQVLTRSIYHQIKDHYSPRTAENLENALKTDNISQNQEEREIFAHNISGVLVETFDEIYNTRYINRHKTDDLSDALAGRFSMAIGHVLEALLTEENKGAREGYDKHLARLNELNAQMKDYLYLYVQLELLKLRIRDRMPPMEGIVVVIEEKNPAKS